jgi:hypothetical protein
MTVMPGLRQFVSLVSKGGTPVMLADAFGNPYPTTGHGSLVFNEGAELFDPILHGVVSVTDRLHLEAGSAALPALTIGDDDTGLYSTGPGVLAVSVNGQPITFFEPSLMSVTGDIAYSGQLQGAYHTPMTTRGDLFYYGSAGPTRLGIGSAGNMLVSNGTDLVYTPASTGSVTSISGVPGETVATPDPILTTGTIGLDDTAVTPGIYGGASNIPQFQVDAKGRLISAVNVPVSTGGSVTSVTAGTGLASTPSPIVTAGTIRLADTAVSPAIYGSATEIPQITVDQQGRITLASNIAVSIPPAGVTSISQGTGITLTPNPLVATGTIAVNTAVVALKTDLNAYLPLVGGVVTGTVTFQPPAPLTTSTPAISVLQTWNNAAVDFRALSMNVTDSASSGASRLVSLQVGSSDRFYVDKFGNMVTIGVANIGGSVFANGSGIFQAGTPMTAGGIQDAGLLFSNVAHFGEIFGTGAPNKLMARGSLYLRNDDTGLPYANFDGTATGWARMAALAVSDVLPAAAPDDQLLWRSDLGQLFIRYNDGNTTQWVPAAPSLTAAAPANQQDGVLRLYSEQVLVGPVNQIVVTCPAGAKLVQLQLDAQLVGGTADFINVQAMAGGSPITVAGYSYQYIVGQATVASAAANVGGSAWTWGNGIALTGTATGSLAPGVNNNQVMFIATFGSTRPADRLVYEVEWDLVSTGVKSTITGFRVTAQTGISFLAGSALRCYVVT